MNLTVSGVARALHVLFFVFVTTGVLWMQWAGMALIFIALRIQDAILGGCILTKLEFGSYKKYWSEHYSLKYFKISAGRWKIFADWVFPTVLVSIAYIIQH